MHRFIVAALCALTLVAPASASEPEEYDAWANQPKEPFTRGDAALREIREKLLHDYYRSDITAEDLDRAAAQGMLAYVDAHARGANRLLSPTEFQELQTDLAGELVGIGVLIDFDGTDGLIDVQGVIPGSPAAAADLREGDKILAIDGQTFKGKQQRDMLTAMRGKEGTTVKLGLLRDAQLVTKTITRQRIQYDPVSTVRLPNDVLLLEIRAFVATTPAAVKAALEQAKGWGARGLVVDLRDDSGGALESALDTAKLFLPAGKVITQIRHRGGQVERMAADGAPALGPVPTVVLVNGETKSSAELLAAALREGLNAPVIGTKTYGKWSVQVLAELPNKYVAKYTVGVFQSPSGQSYDGEGMAPDVEVPIDPKALNRSERVKTAEEKLAVDTQLRAAHNLLRMRP